MAASSTPPVRPDARAPAPRLRLVTGPPGSGRSALLLERVRAAATQEGDADARGRPVARPGEALLLLPTYGAAQHTLRTALVRWDARGLLDDVFVTFTSAGERFLPGFRVRSLASLEERDRLLLLALEREASPLLAPVVDAPGFRSRLLRLVKDVKQGAAPPAEGLALLAARAERLPSGPRERLAACAAAAQHYQALLAQAGLEDHEDALHRLLAALRADPAGTGPALLAVDGFDDMTPVETEILLALAARARAQGSEMLVSLPSDPARPDLFAAADALGARLRAAGFVEQRLAGFARAPGGALARLAACAFGPAGPVDGALPPADDLVRWEAEDPDDEAACVAREVHALLLEAGRPEALVRGPRDVLVVLPDAARRAPRVRAALEELGVPAETAVPRPLAAEPWVRAVRGVLPLLAGDDAPAPLHAPDLLLALRYGALHGTGPARIGDVDAQDLAWREAGFPAGWPALRAQALPGLRAPLDLLEAWRQRLAQGGDPALLLQALDACVPVPRPAGLDAEGRPRDAAHDRRVALALRARAQVHRLVEERARAAATASAAAGPTEGGGADAARDLLRVLPRALFAEAERRLDVVHVLDPDLARSWEAPVVVLAGLDEDGLPRRPVEDPLLGDDEREAVAGDGGLDLPTSRTYQQRERRRLLTLLTRARRRLVLVRARRTAEGEELPPSPLWREVERALGAAAPAPRRALPAAPGVPALARALTPRHLARWAALQHGRREAAPAERRAAARLLARLDPDLPRRAARWRRRAADPLPPEALPRLVASVARLSASRLDAARACAQRHFLEQVLGVPGDEVPLTGPRQGPLDLGRLVHAALHRALAQPAEAPEAVAAAVLEAAGVTGPERAPLAHELSRVTVLLRDRERVTAGPFAPVAGWLERALEAQPLGAGPGAFVLTGRIDRLDADGPRALVVDYKLGAAAPAAHARDTLQGHDLQLPLYAAALARQAGWRVVGLEWMSAVRRQRASVGSEEAAAALAARAEGRKPTLLAPEAFAALLDDAEARAAELVQRVAAGDHELRPRDAGTCGRCPVREACRPDEAALRAALRLEASAEEEDDA